MRRFIAGAKCDRCGAVDRIYVELDERTRQPYARGCFACGHVETVQGEQTVQVFDPEHRETPTDKSS